MTNVIGGNRPFTKEVDARNTAAVPVSGLHHLQECYSAITLDDTHCDFPVVVFDKVCSASMQLELGDLSEVGTEAEDGSTASDAISMLKKGCLLAKHRMPRIRVVCLFDASAGPQHYLPRITSILCSLNFSDINLDLHIHAPVRPTPWEAILDLLQQIWASLSGFGKSIHVTSHILGDLEFAGEETARRLIQNDVKLSMVWDGEIYQAEDQLTDQEQRLRAFAEFGFRIPVFVYVNDANLCTISDLISRWLFINTNSGFAMEPAHLDPSQPVEETVVDVVAYHECVLGLYMRYSHFDEVFAPIAGIVEALIDAPKTLPPLSFLVDSGSQLRLFRKSPNHSKSIDSTSNLENICEAVITEMLEDPAGVEGTSEDCATCKWRWVCGGIEAGAHEHTCTSWKLLLEIALREKLEVSARRRLPGTHAREKKICSV